MGSVYPLWIEKIVFLGLIVVSIYIGIMLQDYISGAALWATRLCLLPIMILVSIEGIGRVVQSIYTR